MVERQLVDRSISLFGPERCRDSPARLSFTTTYKSAGTAKIPVSAGAKSAGRIKHEYARIDWVWRGGPSFRECDDTRGAEPVKAFTLNVESSHGPR